MADDISGSSKPNSPSSAVRRAATDPIIMEERSSQDREAPISPRVRFSQDLDRATASAATGQRPGTPDLSIDTRIAGQKSSGGLNPAASILSRKSSNPVSPTSPRTRDRGYSLRRSLFARSINNQSELSPVELVEAGPSSASQDDSVHGQEEGKSKRGTSSVTVSPVFENHLRISQNSLDEPLFENQESKKDKKTFGTINLPNYDVWARQTVKSNAWLQRLKDWKKQATKIILRQTQIPPSKDGRHIELDAARKTTLIDERTGHPYIGNAIRSSRYTLWNFVPRQLFFQFSKLANAYFLLVSILQMVPGLSTTGSYTTIAPLLVFVTISMGKVSSISQAELYQIPHIWTLNVLALFGTFSP
jgi:phospholipid-translocating ATPase